MAERDVDEQFAAIVAHWDEVALGLDPYGDPGDSTHPSDLTDPTDPTHSADHAHPTDPTRAVDDVRETDEVRGPAIAADPVPEVLPPTGLVEALEHLDALPDSDLDGHDAHYVPPPPAPLPPSEDKHFWTMIAALVVGPVLFLYLLLFNRDGNGWWMMFALMVSIAGFVLLVLRQPLDRDEDDDGIRL